MKYLIAVLLLFNNKILFAQNESDHILGIWMANSKDLKVEIFKQENKYFGKVVWFKCNPKGPAMDSYFDTKNPDPSLRNRKWDGLISVENLEFSGNHWKNGTIYDPHTGHKYSAIIKLLNPNLAAVRGFWAFEFLGRNMLFNRNQ